MALVCAKFIPNMLTAEQKILSFEIAQNNLQMATDRENVLKKIIIMMNRVFMINDPETKQQLSECQHVQLVKISGQCWLFISIMKMLCPTNGLKVFGQTVSGFFPTIMHQRIPRPLSVSLTTTQYRTASPGSVQSWNTFLRLLAAPKIKNATQWTPIRRQKDVWA